MADTGNWMQAVGPITGGLGFVLSCVSLWRSYQNSAQTRALTFAQKKQEAFGMLADGEVAIMKQQRALRGIVFDARRLDLRYLIAKAEEFEANGNRMIAKNCELRNELRNKTSSNITYDKLLEFVDKELVKFFEATNPSAFEEETLQFITTATQQIALVEQALAAGIDRAKIPLPPV
jgi:hypothetical protein